MMLTITDKTPHTILRIPFPLDVFIYLCAGGNLENTVDQNDCTDHISCHYVCDEPLNAAE